MVHFAKFIDEDDSALVKNEVVLESTHHRKSRLFSESDDKFKR
jgi:hypothetical protein